MATKKKKVPKTSAPKAPLTVQEFASMGGKARANKLSAKRIKEIASKAAEARWGKKK